MNAEGRNTTLIGLAGVSMSELDRARAEDAVRMSETFVSLLMSVAQCLGFGARHVKAQSQAELAPRA